MKDILFQCAMDGDDTILFKKCPYGDIDIYVSDAGKRSNAYLVRGDIEKLITFLSEHIKSTDERNGE